MGPCGLLLLFVLAEEHKDRYTTGKQHSGRKISQVTKFPHSEEPSVLTSDLNIEEPGSEHFPKHNQSILKQRKIIPQRNLMSRPLNVSLFCQHELLPPAILWKTPMISFLLLSVMNPTLILRCQNSKAFTKSGHDWNKSLLMSLSVINRGINQRVCQKNCVFLSSSPGIKTSVCDCDVFVS